MQCEARLRGGTMLGGYLIIFAIISVVRCHSLQSWNDVIRPKVIIDADPGADDAMAMLLFLSKRSRADVVAITCVTGNTDVEKGSINTLKTLSIASRSDIPVFLGSVQGLVYSRPSDNFFGLDGFGDFNFTKAIDRSLLKKDHAAKALVKFVCDNPDEITLICLGPLTNVALAIHLYPSFLTKLKKLIFLGGSYQGVGNVRPGVEFNMYSDPEAAALVFSKASSKSPVTVVPVETVKSTSISMFWRKNIFGELKFPVIKFLNKAERIALMNRTQWLPYDPLAAMSFLQPDIILGSMKANVLVETAGRYLVGATVIDYKSNSNNSVIITSVNSTLFQHYLVKYMDATWD